jgi:pimeloyl-ACP methyl ester carboxylesterase
MKAQSIDLRSWIKLIFLIISCFLTSVKADTSEAFCQTVSPTEQATFDASTWILRLPVVKVDEQAYAIQFQGKGDFTFYITQTCPLNPVPHAAKAALFNLSSGTIDIPLLYAGEFAYSARLLLDASAPMFTSATALFEQQPPVIFQAPLADIHAIVAKLDYPVLLIHGLNSSAEKGWQFYINHWQTERDLVYGGKIRIRDVYHVSEPGGNVNANVFKRTPFSLLYAVDVVGGDQYHGDFYTMNFSNNSDISFAAQGLQLQEGVDHIIEWTGKPAVYLVAHSMGGLAARAYLQYFYDNKIKGLITMGTPHFGSTLANLNILGVGGDVLSQLKTDSEDLSLLNNLSRYPLPGDVAYFAIVVRGFNKAGLDSYYSDDEGDGVVPVWSQSLADWESQEVIIEEDELLRLQVHTLETADPAIEKIVWDKLNTW